MKNLIVMILMVGAFAAAVAQDDISRDLGKAKLSYKSQVEFAAKSYLQKFESIKKTSSKEEESNELAKAKASYKSQVEFAAKSYLQKLESMKKMPAIPKNQVKAITSEIAQFKPNTDPPVPTEKPEVKAADNKVAPPAPPKKDLTAAVDRDKLPGKTITAPPENQGADANQKNLEKTADGAIPVKAYTEVEGNTLDNGHFNIQDDVKKLSIGDLTDIWLKERHRFASGRPRPENYDFTQDAFNSYATSIPQDKRIAEEKRFKQVSGIKDYIVRLMERNAYDKPIKLKNGSLVSGAIMVNSRYISVKGKSERLGWNSIPVDQVASMLDYFAEFRLKAGGGVNVSKPQQKLEAAEDYLRIGVLCDWYGDYESAVKFAQKAVATDPKVEDSVKKYIMQ